MLTANKTIRDIILDIKSSSDTNIEHYWLIGGESFYEINLFAPNTYLQIGQFIENE